MATEHILHLLRSDSDKEYVLVNVSSGGPSPLDLKLLATEGEYPYTATSEFGSYSFLRQTLTANEVKQSRLSKLRDKRNQLSDSQWENLLHSTLLQRRTQGSEASSIEKLEVLASLTGDQLSISFRNNISGITQKLGEVVFAKDETQELDITRWAGTAVERSNRIDKEVRDLTSRYDEQSKKMEKLNTQLEALIKAKTEHENALLQKFMELLNTKKLKIRDQQRLLASAKLDPKQAAKLQKARSDPTPRAATISRVRKRKVESGYRFSESSEESGFEGKVPKQKPKNDLSEQITTPERSDQDVTEDESDDDPESAHQAATPIDSSQADPSKVAIGEGFGFDNLPPSRGLPFGEDRKEQANRPLTEDQPMPILENFLENERKDEETDDDEL